MRIAAVTDDGITICSHFGRAQYFMVFSVEEGRIESRDLRAKAGHHEFAHASEHEHDEGHHHEHGMGTGARARHTAMMDTITDCEALLTRGMGRGAYQALEQAGIKPIVTDRETIAEAVRAYVRGDIENHTERLH